jgi:N-hydroxyarylamine O-acetyltransferase
VDDTPPTTWTDRYLRFLGLEREPPSRQALARLTRAQIERVVFENVTAILRRAETGFGRDAVPPPDPDALLEAWEARRGGGVCFDLAPVFRRLLVGLGYRVTPILAQISFPGSHHASIVDLDGSRYLVDVGSGSPLWQPVALGATIDIEHLGLEFRLRPEGDDYVRERRLEGEWALGCRYDLRPAPAVEREAAYQRHQLAGETWVVGNLTIVRCTADAVYRLRDDELAIHGPGGSRVERLGDGDYARVAADVFGLPALPVDAALAALADVRRSAAGVA